MTREINAGRRGERDRIQDERHAIAEGEEKCADRWAAELVEERAGRIEPGVCFTELRFRHRGEEQCAGCVVREGFRSTEQEQRQIDGPQRRMVQQDGESERADHDGAKGVGGNDHQPAVEPVHQGAAEQGEQEPGELLDEGGSADRGRFVGDRGNEKRPGGEHRTVTEVGDGRGGPDLAEVRPEFGGQDFGQKRSHRNSTRA
nr:hypothetical protein [Kribbella qitaiheensis]